jgi:hypothetical protein
MITVNYAAIPYVLVALMLAAYIYDAVFVDNLALHLPARWRRTSVEVVIGVTFTLVGVGIVMGVQVMLLSFVLFASSGIPMIRGDFRRTDKLVAR